MNSENTTAGALPAVELTEASRYRKLALCVLTLAAVHAVQLRAGEPVTWPVVAADSVVVLAFVAANVLDKALQSGALGQRGKLAESAGLAAGLAAKLDAVLGREREP